jgi:hypothetical protein
MVQRGGAHYPQIWGAPDQGVAGDGLGSRDQVLEIKNSNILPLDLQGSKLNSKLKKLNLISISQ